MHSSQKKRKLNYLWTPGFFSCCGSLKGGGWWPYKSGNAILLNLPTLFVLRTSSLNTSGSFCTCAMLSNSRSLRTGERSLSLASGSMDRSRGVIIGVMDKGFDSPSNQSSCLLDFNLVAELAWPWLFDPEGGRPLEVGRERFPFSWFCETLETSEEISSVIILAPVLRLTALTAGSHNPSLSSL